MIIYGIIWIYKYMYSILYTIIWYRNYIWYRHGHNHHKLDGDKCIQTPIHNSSMTLVTPCSSGETTPESEPVDVKPAFHSES